MILRFEGSFGKDYIKDSFRHETFKTLTTIEVFKGLIHNFEEREDQEELRQLITKLQSNLELKNSGYIYYQAKYRVNYNNVIIRLRGWGQKVKVLFQQKLRDRMAKDSQETAELYNINCEEKRYFMSVNSVNKPMLTVRFEEALIYANKLHAHQVRKSSNIPYISHLLSVAALVLEDGGDEDEAIAALLHDAIEDQGGAKTREEIREKFGERVTYIVNACSETEILPKPLGKSEKTNI